MNGLCVIVTHNRLEYTKRAVEAFWETQPIAGGSDARWPLIIVDNASTDGTREWLSDTKPVPGVKVFNDQNLFPGAATNIGWHKALKTYDVDLLMRLDNDIELLPGWRQEVERCFNRVDNLGQLGILNRHEDYDGNQPVTLDDTGTVNVHHGQVGGNCVIPRVVWDHGVRWRPGAWAPGGLDEDAYMSATVKQLGGLVGEVVPTIANNISFHRFDDYPDYYRRTAALRGLVPELSV